MLISLSGSNQVAPNFWLNPANGVSYNVGVQTPQYRLDSLDALLRTPVTAATSTVDETTPGSLAGAARPRIAFTGAAAERRVAGVRQSRAPSPAATPAALESGRACSAAIRPVIVNHYNVAPVFDVYANVDRRDLGSVGAEVEKIMREEEPKLPRGTTLDLRGAGARRCRRSFFRLGLGHDLRRGAGVPADGGELPVVARSVHHPDGAAGRDGRDPLDAVRHRHDAERAVADGLDHVHRRGDGEQHPAGDVRQRRARRRTHARAKRCCRPATRASGRC